MRQAYKSNISSIAPPTHPASKMWSVFRAYIESTCPRLSPLCSVFRIRSNHEPCPGKMWSVFHIHSPATKNTGAETQHRCLWHPLINGCGKQRRVRSPAHAAAQLLSCARICGSLIFVSSASSTTLERTSAVRGSSSRNGRNSRPRCWECTGIMYSAPVACLYA